MHSQIYISDFRPIEVKEYGKLGDSIIDQDGEEVRKIPTIKLTGNSRERDFYGILPLIMETVSIKRQVLVFCPTKKSCEDYCQLFYEKIEANSNYDKTLQYKDNFNDQVLFKYVLKGGVGYHHSGL